MLLKHQNAFTLLIVAPSCSADNEAIKPEHNIKTKQEEKKMTHVNMTEIKMEQLEKITGGFGETGPLGTGPLTKGLLTTDEQAKGSLIAPAPVTAPAALTETSFIDKFIACMRFVAGKMTLFI